MLCLLAQDIVHVLRAAVDGVEQKVEHHGFALFHFVFAASRGGDGETFIAGPCVDVDQFCKRLHMVVDTVTHPGQGPSQCKRLSVPGNGAAPMTRARDRLVVRRN